MCKLPKLDQSRKLQRSGIQLLALLEERPRISKGTGFFNIPIVDEPLLRLDHVDIASYVPPPSGYVQLVVAGAGPAGIAVAARVS